MFVLKPKCMGKARIKDNAIVGQDHGFCRWKNSGEIFEVYDFLPHRKELIADGYGKLDKPNSYGNGSLFVKNKDIEWLNAPAEILYENELMRWMCIE